MRVTIDADLGMVGMLRNAAAAVDAAGAAPPSMPRTATDLRALADAIEAALPMPEPAGASLVRICNGSVYAHTEGVLLPWVAIAGPDRGSREDWRSLICQDPVVVFDGACVRLLDKAIPALCNATRPGGDR